MTTGAVTEPAISEVTGGLEVWADGAVVRYGNEVITVLLYQEDQSGCRTETLRVRMPPSGFAKSLLNTWQSWIRRSH